MSDLPINSYVELKNVDVGVYKFSQPGQHGWIRDHKLDEYNFSKVYIEWDRSDWRYNGEPDGWTFESHFVRVEEDFDTKLEEEVCEHCGHSHPTDSEITEKFLEELHHGTESALAADGFIIITVREDRDEDNKVSVYAPEIFQAFLTTESVEMIEAQLLHLASMSFQEAAIDRLNQIRKRNEE